MIQKVSFRNFKAYRSLELELEPFTVLVGPNASGKTTLLEGLVLATHGVDGIIAKELQQASSHDSKGPVELMISGSWQGTPGTARVYLSREPTQDGGLGGVNIEWDGNKYYRRFAYESSSGGNVFPEEFIAALSTTTVLRFDSRRLAEPAYSDEQVPSVASDGSGLAAVLAYLKLSDDDAFQEIESALQEIVPAVQRIRIERAAIEHMAVALTSLDVHPDQVPANRTVWGNKIVLDMKGAKKVPVTAVGEGTLMALGLLTVLMGPAKPRLVLLDDIELALHPVAQGKLVEILRKIRQQDPELQIIATSHSPFILNYLDPQEIRMTLLAGDGSARCQKLTGHPEFERWKDLMSPGEFWSTVGESWLEKAGETPVHE